MVVGGGLGLLIFNMCFIYFESPFCFLLFVKLVHQVYLSLSLTQEVLTSDLL